MPCAWPTGRTSRCEDFYKYNALPIEESQETRAYYKDLWDKGFRYPGVHSFRAGGWPRSRPTRMRASRTRLTELDFIELHDAYTSSEIQTYEDMGLCRYGEGGPFAEGGKAFMPGIDYGLKLKEKPECPVNPSGGLIACGHPVGATGLMQGVFALWQLQGTIDKHFRRPGPASPRRQTRRHPPPCRHRHLRDRQHSGKGQLGGSHGEKTSRTKSKIIWRGRLYTISPSPPARTCRS